MTALREMIHAAAEAGRRAWRYLRRLDCPCAFCTAHRAHVEQTGPAYAREVARGGEYACVTCGARDCPTWPAVCEACATRADGEIGAYLQHLATEAERDRGHVITYDEVADLPTLGEVRERRHQ